MKQYEEIMGSLNLTREEVFNQSQKEGKVGTWILDCSTGECWWSDELYHILGIKKSREISWKTFAERVYEEDVAKVQTMYDRLKEKKYGEVIHRIAINDKIKWFVHKGRFYDGSKSSSPYMLGVVHEITQVIQEQKQDEVKHSALIEINKYFSQMRVTGDIKSLALNIEKAITKIFDAVLAGFYIIQDKKLNLARGKVDDFDSLRALPDEDLLAYRAVLSGKIVECSWEDYPNAPGREAIHEQGGNYIVSIPVKDEDKVVAVLTVVFRRSDPLSKEETKICRLLGDTIGVQLKNVISYGDLKKKLFSLSCTEADLDMIFSESVDYISMIDKKGNFIRLNSSFVNRLGYGVEGVQGQPVIDFIYEEDKDIVKKSLKNMPKIGVVKGLKNRYVCKNGDVIKLMTNAKYSEKTGIIVAVARDITEQDEAEARTLELQKSVALEKLKGEFFANLSHEFKTPLNIIISSLDLLQLKLNKNDEDIFEREYKKFISYAYQNCYKLLRLTTNLLDSTKIDNQFLKAQFYECRLVLLLEEITKSAEIYAHARGIDISFDSKVDSELNICCDIDQIDRILLNLISNAIKNTPAGGSIQVKMSQNEAEYVISVEDNGVGIPQEFLPHIFERFHFTEKGPMANHDGSGIGLSIVKALVKMHGGSIRAESSKGVGSRFIFTISKNLVADERLKSQFSQGMGFDFEARQSRVKMELSNID